MTTEQKLEQIVDRLLIMTQDGQCEWKPTNDYNKFSLKTNAGCLYIYTSLIVDTGIFIVLDVTNNANENIVLAFLKENKSNTNSNLVRLFDTVIKYRQDYVNSFVDKLILELQKKLGDQPF